MQVAPGGGGGEEGGVKVNLFRKKNLVGSNMHRIYFQGASVIYCLGLR